MTRIIAGTARGRRLAVPARGTRPTSDRVRESLFSALDSELAAGDTAWSQVRVLDLFAGSGALGLEALSRGAASVLLVERSRAASRVIAANVDAVGGAGARVLVRDAWQLPALPPQPVDLCLVDPPYEVEAVRIAGLIADLESHGWLAPGCLVVVERPAADDRAPFPDDWDEPRRRRYGDTALWYGRRVDARGEERA